MTDLMPPSASDASDVLLHPDALHCLQKKQLVSLCIRLDLKAIGKKEELIARLEGYAKGNVALGTSPSKGLIVQARPRMASLVSDEAINDKENEVEMGESDGLEQHMTSAGPSIRLIKQSNADEGRVEKSGSQAASILGEREADNNASNTKSIYPWKRMSSASSLTTVRASSASTVKAGPISSDDTMTLDELGKGSEAPEEQKGSLSNLKKWLTRSASSSSSLLKKASDKDITPTPEPNPSQLASPASKRKRDEDEVESKPFYMCDMQEVPVKRVIKARPSRAIKKAIISSDADVVSPLTDLSNAANKVLEEMNARLQQNGKATAAQIPVPGAWSVNLKPPASPLKSVNARTKGRFSGEHAKHFKKMDSIASHYAAKRIEMANKEWRSASNGSTSSSRNVPSPAKKLKIAEPTEEQVIKTAEHRAAVQKKLEISRQRRKSTTASKPGFRSRISGAVRGFVGAAVGKASNANEKIAPSLVPAPRVQPRRPSPAPAVANSSHLSGSKPVFDLKASLAKKPTGYTPYSAKETVQLLQAASSPSKVPSSPVPAPSPIRSGWTVVTTKSTGPPVIPPRVASSKAAIAFPTLSPPPASDLATAVKAAPSIVRKPSAHIAAARKTRSSMSNAKKGSLQAEKLKRVGKVNDMIHQASMAAKRKNAASVQRAIDKSERIAAELNAGAGRGSTRKASAKIVMEGAGRGVAAVKRIS